MHLLFTAVLFFLFQNSLLFCSDETEKSNVRKFDRWKKHDSKHLSKTSALKPDKKTFFTIQADIHKKIINDVLHPILHGSAEDQTSFWEKVKTGACKTYSLLQSGEFSQAMSNTKNSALWPALATVIGAAVGSRVERALFHGGLYESGNITGIASLDALQKLDDEYQKLESCTDELMDAAQEANDAYPSWKEQKDIICPQGVLHCSKLGNNSKTILKTMYTFFNIIEHYEKRTGHSYFRHEDSLRIFNFIGDTRTRICVENLLHAITTKQEMAPNDEQLKGYVRVMSYLMALPTHMHNPLNDWKKNSFEIEDSLSFLPISQKREMYRYMRKLLKRSQNPNYGHQDGDSSINLLFSGPTGTGKTFLGKKLPPLLGFNPIIIKLAELQEGQNRSLNSITDLIECDMPLSGLEKKLLCLNNTKTRSIMPCNPICFIDELDEDRNHTISELKDQFDQFKRIYLPSLGIEIPGFLNCIFTTNNENFLKDPALISRFVQIRFPKMTPDKKFGILNKMMQKKLKEEYQHLQSREQELKGLLKRLVEFDDNINIRILIDNIDSVIDFVEMDRIVQSKNAFLFPLEDHNSETRESYEEFLTNQFSNLNLDEKRSDSTGSDLSFSEASSSSS